MDISRDIVISFSEYYDFIIRELYTLPIFYTIRWDRKKKIKRNFPFSRFNIFQIT